MILILVGSTVVGSFLSMVMIRSNNRKKEKAKAKAAVGGQAGAEGKKKA